MLVFASFWEKKSQKRQNVVFIFVLSHYLFVVFIHLFNVDIVKILASCSNASVTSSTDSCSLFDSNR